MKKGGYMEEHGINGQVVWQRNKHHARAGEVAGLLPPHAVEEALKLKLSVHLRANQPRFKVDLKASLCNISPHLNTDDKGVPPHW